MRSRILSPNQCKMRILKTTIYGICVLGMGAGIYKFQDQYQKGIENLVKNAPIVITEWENSPNRCPWDFYSGEELFVDTFMGKKPAKKTLTWDLYQERFKELNKEKRLDGKIKVPDLDRDGNVGLEDK